MQSVAGRYLIACVLLAVACVGANVVHGRRGAPAQVAFDPQAVPLVAGPFTGSDNVDASQIEQALGAQAVLSRMYRAASPPPVRLTVVYGTEWRSIHAPTGCYPAQGWNVERDEAIDVPVSVGGGTPVEPLHARLLHATKQGRDEYALFLYAYPGGTTADWARQGWKVATGPNGAGGLVLIAATEVARGSGEDGRLQAEKCLVDLLSALYMPSVAFWEPLLTPAGG